ncbi:bifunctional DNA primase/polymerase, partial [Luedemannella flava]
SGLVVVDVDPAHDGLTGMRDLIRASLLPRTAIVQTGSGGLHLYYRHPRTPILNSQSRLGLGIDVRGDGGYVVAPPSIHPRTRLAYRWADEREPVEMPRALVTACQPPPAPQLTGPTLPSPTSRGEGISSPDALLAAHLDAVARAPEGRRRTTLYGAARGGPHGRRRSHHPRRRLRRTHRRRAGRRPDRARHPGRHHRRVPRRARHITGGHAA